MIPTAHLPSTPRVIRSSPRRKSFRLILGVASAAVERREQPSSPPRWVSWLGPSILLAGFLATFAASAVTGPTFDEERRVHAVVHAMALPRAFADSGPGVTVSSAARGIYAELAPFGVWPGLLSGLIAEIGRRLHFFDILTTIRAGWLLIAGAAPGALYYLVERSRGYRVAALAAAILFATPRWTHGAAVASEAVVVASLWLVLVAIYVRSYPPSITERRRGTSRRFRPFGIWFALALGAALSATLATLWVLPILVAHSVLTSGTAGRRALGRARVIVPSGALLSLVLVPVTVALMTPQLWRGGGVVIADWLFAPLAPTVEPSLYRKLADVDHVPAFYAADFLVATTPVVTLLVALCGAVLLFQRHRRARSKEEPRDPVALGFLSLVVVAAVVIGPALAPRPLLRFPPRAEAALPFIAAACAIGVEFVARRLVGERRRNWALIGASVMWLATGLVGLPAAGASFGLLAGETRGAARSGRWVTGDGSELSLLAPAIDAMGRPRLSLDGADVPRGYFVLLRGLERLHSNVDMSKSGAGFMVVRGDRSDAIARVKHWGTPLWSLVPR